MEHHIDEQIGTIRAEIDVAGAGLLDAIGLGLHLAGADGLHIGGLDARNGFDVLHAANFQNAAAAGDSDLALGTVYGVLRE